MFAPAARSSGFTLIELLAVVAIIGVLAALVVPAVGRSLEKAAMTTDLNSLKSVGAALAAFTAENNGRIPISRSPGRGHRIGKASWRLSTG